MARPTLSDDEFSRLQEQLINLRTENYELVSQLQKAQAELTNVQEKCCSQEKELARVSKMMKFPGFQAITKNKRRGNYDEVVEENERLNRQMQRHEEDFNLQNKTLLEEVSRVTAERNELESQLSQLKEAKSTMADENDEMRRLKAENAALQKKIRSNTAESSEPLSLQARNEDGELSSESSEGENPLSRLDGDLRELHGRLSEAIEHGWNNRADENKTDEEKAGVSLQSIHATLDTHFRSFQTQLASAMDLMTAVNSQDAANLAMKLETEMAEKNLILEQLNDEREKFKKETSLLKDERDKLQVKNTKKQASFVQIQEEKDKLYNEKKDLEENLVKVTDIVQQQQAELEEWRRMLEIARMDKEKTEEELRSLKEKTAGESGKGMAELRGSLAAKNALVDDLEARLQNQSSVCTGLEKQVLALTDENERVKAVAQENGELAESRKALLDEMSIEQQVVMERHSDEIKQCRLELQAQRELFEKDAKVKQQLSVDNTRLQETVAALENAKDAVDKKSGWLERTLKEAEATLNEERQEHKLALAAAQEETETRLSKLRKEYEDSLQAERDERDQISQELKEQKMLVAKLNQATKDREVEFRIGGKKNEHLVKDLKRQLALEKKRADQVQQRLQEFLAEAKVKQTFDELFSNETTQYKGHRRQDSGSHLSNISSLSNPETDENDLSKSSSPARRPDTVVNAETMDLINRLAELQQDKWILEEKVRHLEENGATMADDLMQKSTIIQAYVMDTKPDSTPEHARRKNLTLKEKMIDTLKPGRTEETLREMTVKLQRMLEETLMKNVQLQQDVDHLAQKLQESMKSGEEGS